MNSGFDECRILAIPGFTDQRGRLSVIDGPPQFPFELRRVYYLYDVPADAHRGCHAHRSVQELIVALAGSFKVARVCRVV